MRHATSRKSHQWTAEADERLLKAIRMYGHENWHLGLSMPFLLMSFVESA